MKVCELPIIQEEFSADICCHTELVLASYNLSAAQRP